MKTNNKWTQRNLQKSPINAKTVLTLLSALMVANNFEISALAQSNSSGRSDGVINAAGGVGTASGTHSRRGHRNDGVSPTVRLTAEEKELLSSFMQTAKKVLEKALSDAQGKIFADANAIYLRAIKRVVKASSEQGMKSELLLRIALNQALDLTFGFGANAGDEEGTSSKAGVLRNTANQDLLTLILEDSIQLALSFYENDYQAVQKGSLIDLPYMDFAYKKLELSHKWLASIPEPIKQYQTQVRTLQHFLNVAANPDQKERAKYADALLTVDEFLEEYPSDRPNYSDTPGVMKAVRMLRGETKKLREMVRQELANRPVPTVVPTANQVPGSSPRANASSTPQATEVVTNPSQVQTGGRAASLNPDAAVAMAQQISIYSDGNQLIQAYFEANKQRLTWKEVQVLLRGFRGTNAYEYINVIVTGYMRLFIGIWSPEVAVEIAQQHSVYGEGNQMLLGYFEANKRRLTWKEVQVLLKGFRGTSANDYRNVIVTGYMRLFIGTWFPEVAVEIAQQHSIYNEGNGLIREYFEANKRRLNWEGIQVLLKGFRGDNASGFKNFIITTWTTLNSQPSGK